MPRTTYGSVLSGPRRNLFPALSIASLALVGTALSTQPSAVAEPLPQVQWSPSSDRGSAGGTLSGGRRGQEASVCQTGSSHDTALALLVPATMDGLLTTSERPSLSWHINTPHPVSTKFVLSDPNIAQPIYSQVLEAKSGVSHFTLPANLALKAGTRYRWTVFVSCQGGMGKEIYARSFIKRVQQPLLERTLAGKSGIERAAVFAKAGIWYDALHSLFQALDQNPQNVAIATQLKSLLQQADPGLEQTLQ